MLMHPSRVRVLRSNVGRLPGALAVLTALCLVGMSSVSCSTLFPWLMKAPHPNRAAEAELPAGKPADVPTEPTWHYERVDLLSPASSASQPVIYVYKGSRRLHVVDRGTLVRDYPIGLGFDPVGDKIKEGDGRTPEGEFFVCEKKPNSRYYKALGLSYPSLKHAREAFASGLISIDEYIPIMVANRTSRKPPWSTPLGGAICIHGGGAEEDWTKGCVSLSNRDMEELYRMVREGSVVIIRP